MLGFLIGVFVGICSLMVDHSVLLGLNTAEMICAIIIIMIVFGVFGALIDMILQIINKIKINRR